MGGFHRDPLLPLSFHLLFLDPYSALRFLGILFFFFRPVKLDQ